MGALILQLKECKSKCHKSGQRMFTWINNYLDFKPFPVAEFEEFERRFKFKPRFKYGWFHLKLYQMFQDFSRRINLNQVLADLNRDSNSLNSILIN